jgi:hypothetical protein
MTQLGEVDAADCFLEYSVQSQSTKISLALVGALNVHACDLVAGQEFSQADGRCCLKYGLWQMLHIAEYVPRLSLLTFIQHSAK